MNLKQAKAITGNLSKTSKMPGYSWSISASLCKTGSKLQNIEGSVCASCYALKGNYVWPNVARAHERRLEGYKHPDWVEAMIVQINHYCKDARYFRWFDSGDLQSMLMLIKIAKVCEGTPTVKHWLPTREYGIVRRYNELSGYWPDNLTVRMSSHMIDAVPTDSPEGTVSSVVVTDTAKAAGHMCQASTRGGKCGPCRVCWFDTVKTVSYKLH